MGIHKELRMLVLLIRKAKNVVPNLDFTAASKSRANTDSENAETVSDMTS
jgi:hypothetical protein